MTAWRDAAELEDSPGLRQSPGIRRLYRVLREISPARAAGHALTVHREPGGLSAPFLCAREWRPRRGMDRARLRRGLLRPDSPGLPTDSARAIRYCKQNSRRLLTVPAVLSPDFAK